MIFVSVHSVHSIFKIRQTVSGVYITNQFHEFLFYFLVNFFNLVPLWAAAIADVAQTLTQIDGHAGRHTFYTG